MPTRGKISEYFDFDGLNAEKIKVRDSISDFIAEINKGVDIRIKLTDATGARDIAKGFDDLANSSDKVVKASDKIVASQKELTKAQAAARVATQQRNQDLKQEVISTTAAAGSYDQLNAQLKILSKQYRALSDAERDSASGKALQADILDKNTQLKTLDYSLGNYQRNVGNYSSALSGYALTLRGLRGPVKLLGEALGVGAQEADQLRLILEHAFQALSKFFGAREEKAAATAAETAATEANTAAQEANNAAQAAGDALAARGTGPVAAAGATENGVVAGAGLAEEVSLQAELNELKETANTVEEASAKVTELAALAKEHLTVASTAEAAATEAGTTANIAAAVASAEATTAIEAEAAATVTATAATTQNTIAEGVNIPVTEGMAAAVETAAVAETQLAVATTTASTAMKVFKIAIASTGIGLLLAAIGAIVYKIIEYRKELAEANALQKLFADVNDEAAKSAGKEAGSLVVLRAEIENTLIPQAKRLQAVKDLKEQYPDLLKNVTDEALLNGKVADSYDLITASIIKKAKAEASEKAIQDLVAANIDVELKSQLELEATKKRIASAKDDVTIASGGTGGGGGNFGGATAIQKGKKFLADYQAYTEQAAETIRKNNEKISFLLSFAAVSENIDPGKKDAVEDLQALKDRLNTEFDIYKVSQTAKIRLYDEQIKSDKTYYLDKLAALNNYISAEKELIDKQEANDIAAKKREAAREIQRLTEEKGGKTDDQKARIDQNIKTVEYNLQQAILLIQAEAADKQIALAQTTADRRNKITDDYLKNDQSLYDDYAKEQQKNIDATNAAFKKGLDKRQKDEDEAAKKLVATEKELADKKVEFYKKGEDLIAAIGEAGFDNALNNIKDQEDANDAKAARDIEIANASGDTEERKAARIAIINARSAAVKANLDKQANEIDVKKAKFERAQQIFDIAITTIKSVAAVKAQAAILLANPLTAAYASVALAEIPYIIGSGIASAAALLATPIPKYKHGTDDTKHPGGLAEVGDGFVRELILEPDGTIRVTPDRPTVMDLPKGTTVFPDADKTIRAMMMHHMKQVISAGTKVDVVGQAFPIEHFDKTMHRGFKSVVSAINKNRPAQRNSNGYDRLFGNGFSESEYLKNNLQGKK